MSDKQKITMKIPDKAALSLEMKIPDYNEGYESGIPIKIESDLQGMDVIAEGYGMKTMMPGEGPVFTLERYEGKLQLLVWADINQEDPTHVIDLEGARESLRKPE